MAAVYVGQTQGTVKPANPFNPEEDGKRLRKAMKGFGKLSVCSADIYRYNVFFSAACVGMK